MNLYGRKFTKRVGFGPRLGAYVIDAVFITIIVFVMAFLFGAAGAGVGAEAGYSNYLS